jgi:hypothetical protein
MLCKMRPWFIQCGLKTLQCLGIVAFYTILFCIFFSPILLTDHLLAPGDGLVQSIPAFYAPLTLWTDLLLAGFPAAADPTVQSWYPLRLIFSQFHAWNGFVISAYVLASCFTYGYVYTLTKSRLAGLASGLIYSMSGFMMAHLGHISMVHSAAWTPLLIWALERLRYAFTARWFAISVLSIACMALAGHPQIFIYSLGIGIVYVAAFGGAVALGRWRYFGLYATIVILGSGIAAIQLFPTAELARLGPRTDMSFAEFVFYSLAPHQIITFIFPYLFGGAPWSFYHMPYFGYGTPTELSGYIGILPVMLAVLVPFVYRWKMIPFFWSAIAITAFLLTLGDTTPLIKVLYQIPLYNKFRIPSRHFLEMSLAISILSGIGISTLQDRMISNKLLLYTTIVLLIIIFRALVGVIITQDELQALTLRMNIHNFSVLPWDNPALSVPLIISISSCLILLYWYQLPSSSYRQILLVTMLVVDLSSFSWFCEWRYASPHKNLLRTPDHVIRYRKLLDATGQRLFPARGGDSSIAEVPPNISRLWGVRSSSGYGPLIPSRILQLLSIDVGGRLTISRSFDADQSLDIMGVRYIFLSGNNMRPKSLIYSSGFIWSENDLSLKIGSGCNTSHDKDFKLFLPTSDDATSIGIVSAMECSVNIPNGSPVVTLLITDIQNNISTRKILAGLSTAELAYDCEDVSPIVQHDQAPIFESYPIARKGLKACNGHKYFTNVPLNTATRVKEIRFQWNGLPGEITLQKISLRNELTEQSWPLSLWKSFLADDSRWRYIENIQDTIIYENLRALPRIRLVPRVISLTADEILHAIKFSRLPNGQTYDPSQVALVEEPLSPPGLDSDPRATAEVTLSSNTYLRIRTESTVQMYLVLNDLYYPGWLAFIDKAPVHIYRTNYILRGVSIPAGKHVIEFKYQPKTFYSGVLISIISILSVAFIAYQSQNERVKT